MNIGYEIKQIRLKEGLSQIEFSKKIGISRNALINYEQNKRTPPIKVIKKISEVFGINLSYLITSIPEIDNLTADNLNYAGLSTSVSIPKTNLSDLEEFNNFLLSINFPNNLSEADTRMLLDKTKEFLSYEFFKLGYLPVTSNNK